MEACRERAERRLLRRDRPVSRLRGAAAQKLEKPVLRADIPARIRFEDARPPFASDAGIDDRQNDASRREPRRVGGKEVSAGFRTSRRRVGEKIDDRHPRRQEVQNGLHLAGIGPLETEIGKESDHAPEYRKAAASAQAAAARWAILVPQEPLLQPQIDTASALEISSRPAIVAPSA